MPPNFYFSKNVANFLAYVIIIHEIKCLSTTFLIFFLLFNNNLRLVLEMADPQGLEPQLTESKSAVLPLDEGSKKLILINYVLQAYRFHQRRRKPFHQSQQ